MNRVQYFITEYDKADKRDVFFYEIEYRKTGEKTAYMFKADNLQQAESAVYSAAIKTQFNVLQVWNMDVAGERKLGPLDFYDLKSH